MGHVDEIDFDRGLLVIAQMLSAGEVQAPWQLGLSPEAFKDSFEEDMGYVDAFRLWAQSAFDDEPHVRSYLKATALTPSWEGWVQEHVLLGEG